MTNDRAAVARPARALEALNFFLADVQAGIGPFVGVILLSRGWSADAILIGVDLGPNLSVTGSTYDE
ncbi:hypothetical protein CJO66_10755 [Burkholderia ubonensis]|nr:hypothetical protein CJO71_15790 [Burkholderia ubonensis]PAJ86293.1 hypothetical protein CJO70_18020 [Burkholderia ubonensis]PAJ93293.1 hypothetical protein CJO69_17570 [Burkholderia ubonensis]PAK00418.1 hypothetical protein CJO68_14835 [Burkholderia ubonensis]PAK06712.1 hypothetical protein CJO67_17150 [Burkholderia ubonensis]